MTSWRLYFALGNILGFALIAWGVWTQGTAIRVIGAVLPLVGMGIGLTVQHLVDRRRRSSGEGGRPEGWA